MWGVCEGKCHKGGGCQWPHHEPYSVEAIRHAAAVRKAQGTAKAQATAAPAPLAEVQ